MIETLASELSHGVIVINEIHSEDDETSLKMTSIRSTIVQQCSPTKCHMVHM